MADVDAADTDTKAGSSSALYDGQSTSINLSSLIIRRVIIFVGNNYRITMTVNDK